LCGYPYLAGSTTRCSILTRESFRRSFRGRDVLRFLPKARPETPAPQPAAPSGIDYLRLVDTAHQQHLAAQINYAALTDDADPAADIP